MARPKTLSAAKGWTGIPAPMDAPAGGGGPGNFAPARPTGLNTFQAPPLFEPDPLITEGRKVLQPYPLLIKQRTGSECWAASLSSFLMTTRPNESARYSIDSIIERVRDLERRTNEERQKRF
jgi:hypothetical protein